MSVSDAGRWATSSPSDARCVAAGDPCSLPALKIDLFELKYNKRFAFVQCKLLIGLSYPVWWPNSPTIFVHSSFQYPMLAQTEKLRNW